MTAHEHPLALGASAVACAAAVSAAVVVPTHWHSEAATAAVTVPSGPAPASALPPATDSAAVIGSNALPNVTPTVTSANDPFVGSSSVPSVTATSDAPSAAPSVTQAVAAPAVTVTVTAAPAQTISAAAPAAVITPSGRTMSLNDACTTTLTHVAATIEAITYTIRRGDSVNQGHSLGWRVVELQTAADTTVDLDLAALIPSVTNDVMTVRDQMLAETPGMSISIQQLSADTERVSDYCSVRLDPLAGG